MVLKLAFVTVKLHMSRLLLPPLLLLLLLLLAAMHSEALLL
jgi:hypothetical protein